VKNENGESEVAHEATVGKIGDDELFYLATRGYKSDDGSRLIVAGFMQPIIKALPLEYAVEFNKLLELEMTDGVG
jgi:Fe-S cluster assembly protein SufB